MTEGFKIGDVVRDLEVPGDQGVVQQVIGDDCVVLWDKNNVKITTPASYLVLVESSRPRRTEETDFLVVGDIVKDSSGRLGTCAEFSGGNVTVAFDDGETETVPEGDLTRV